MPEAGVEPARPFGRGILNPLRLPVPPLRLSIKLYAMERSFDWFKQALRDLEHAKRSLEAEDYEWACFASHQSAEKAVKALHYHFKQEAWGHSISRGSTLRTLYGKSGKGGNRLCR